MKKLSVLTAAALMTATAATGMLAAPAAAQAQVSFHIGSPGYWTPERTHAIRQQIWQLDRRIDRAEHRGTISRSEARRLNREVRKVRNLYHRYARNGLNYREVRHLQDRVNWIRARLRAERLGWDRQDYWRGDRWRDHDRGWRDYDRDGVHNRHDRDFDNDGVRNGRDRYDRNPYRY